MQNNDALCSPHKLCSECKPNGNICSADNKYYDILGIKGNFLEALQVQKKGFARLSSSKYLLSGLFPYFSFPVQCQCAVSAHREEVNVWSASHARYITHKVCKHIFCDARLFWVSQEIHNRKWHIQLSVQRSALYFPHCPFLSITSQSVSNSGSLPITKASFTLGAGKVDLYINLPTIANEHHNCQWRDNVTMTMFANFVAGEVANNWLEDQLSGQSKGGRMALFAYLNRPTLMVFGQNLCQ